ncbi:MAG: glucosylglycerol-phosphate synthase [Polyangiales bacterium]
MSAPLVILYHREPFDEVQTPEGVRYVEKRKPNGIVPTLRHVLKSSPRSRWVAWKTVRAEERAHFVAQVPVAESNGSVVERILLSKAQVNAFYHITAKEAFWPVLHSFPWNFTYDSSDWETFVDINRRFAEAACADSSEDCVFWIHDYNLWLTPHFIRAQKPKARILFFHHTPFPAADLFNILPWRTEIIDSLLCCDLVGFHIPRYVENFVSAARSLRPVEVRARKAVGDGFVRTGMALAEPELTTQICHAGHDIRVDAFPVGTDPQFIESILARPQTQARIEAIRQETATGKLIVSAGRVDYTKGVKELLGAYERLLERRSDMHAAVQLVLTAVAPADGMRVYREARREIEARVGKINGRFARLQWNPILLFTQPMPFAELVAYLHAADIALITPLRDGLNLVAKEYIATHKGRGGALVLSEFTGAAVELPDAITVNPYVSADLDAAIDRALAMPQDEQQRRMAAMHATIRRFDVHTWAKQMFRRHELAPEMRFDSRYPAASPREP